MTTDNPPPNEAEVPKPAATEEATPPSTKRPRGFAAMSPTQQKEIARRGGRAAHARGTAHEFSRDEAREAGRHGGLAVARDREHMSKIGREGARKSAAVRSKRKTAPTAPSTPPAPPEGG